MAFLREVELRYRMSDIEYKYCDQPLTAPGRVFEVFGDMVYESKEKFISLNLDTKNKVINYETIAVGSLNSVIMRPTEVFRSAVAQNANAIMVIHNHTAGDPTPSFGETFYTKQLVTVGNTLGIKLLDHIIIGTDGYYSFAENSLL